MPRIVIPFVLTFLLCGRIAAQSLSVDPQPLAVFPGTVSNLSLLDGEMYAYTQGLSVHLPRISGNVTAVVGDTLRIGLDKNLSYLVRNPRTGNLFFSTPSSHGSTLYEVVPREGKSPKVKKVKLEDASNITIEHPVFTEDGMIMIFATANRIGEGGSDLWYSEFDTVEQQWGRPVNMGDRINSPGDEDSPAIVEGYLLFSSRNRAPGDSVWSLYATCFRSETASVDTIRRNTIGLSPAYKLPAPINSSADDYEVIADSTSLYWLSRRQGSDALYRCQDALRCAWLHGKVATKDGRPLPNAIVRWSCENGASQTTVTNASGDYQLLLKVGRKYRLEFLADTCFNQVDVIDVAHGKDFIADIRHNVVLDYMPMNVPLSYVNLFVHASADFSQSGLEQMRRLAEFLSMNDKVSISITLSSASYDDMLLDKMLSDSRIEALREYLDLPASKISFTNNTYTQSRLPNAKESEMVVKLSFE